MLAAMHDFIILCWISFYTNSIQMQGGQGQSNLGVLGCDKGRVCNRLSINCHFKRHNAEEYRLYVARMLQMLIYTHTFFFFLRVCRQNKIQDHKRGLNIQ